MILRIALISLSASSLWAQGLPGYGGPAVASRGLRNAGARAGEATSIRPYVHVQGIYDNGLIVAGTTARGEITNPGGLFGVEAQVGAYGAREWKRTRLGMDYQGLYRHYATSTYFNGSDHMLDMDIVHQVTRRGAFNLRGMGGTSSRPVGGLFSFASIEPTYLGLPANDIFDNRTYFADVTGGYTLTIGSRNSISLSGNAFSVRRQSKALIGMNGYRATADYIRRVSRRHSVGFAYQYLHFEFPRVFGESDIHLAMLEYSAQFGRSWRLAAAGGGYRVDLTGTRTVELDPVLVALLGTRTGKLAFNSINHLPYVQLSLSREQRRSTLGFSYTNGPGGGGGVLLTSRQQNAYANYAYRSSEKFSVVFSGGWNSFGGLGAYSGSFQSLSIGVNASRRIASDLYLTAGFDARRFESDFQQIFHRNGSRLFSGITWSPGAFPVSLR